MTARFTNPHAAFTPPPRMSVGEADRAFGALHPMWEPEPRWKSAVACMCGVVVFVGLWFCWAVMS